MPTRHAFTLIELIIVIAIMGILAVVSLTGYNNIRSSAELSLQYDEIVTELRKLQSKSQNIADAKCYGLEFVTKGVDRDPGIYYIESDFRNVRDLCDPTEAETGIRRTGNEYYEKAVIIEKISSNVNSNYDSIEVLFSPPKGEIVIPALGSTEIRLELSVKDKQNNQEIVINTVNETIQKRTKQETEETAS